MRTLLRFDEAVFWLLALVALTPITVCQWFLGKCIGLPTVFRQFLVDLWHFGRCRTRARWRATIMSIRR
jgi:hypothetical protein